MTDPLPRDPRVDPQPGDVLTTGYRTRTVVSTSLHHVRFETHYGLHGYVLIDSWRRWAKRARVEKVGGAT